MINTSSEGDLHKCVKKCLENPTDRGAEECIATSKLLNLARENPYVSVTAFLCERRNLRASTRSLVRGVKISHRRLAECLRNLVEADIVRLGYEKENIKVYTLTRLGETICIHLKIKE
jgi:predicted transcriptional regulator